jgi:hypothetical protein
LNPTKSRVKITAVIYRGIFITLAPGFSLYREKTAFDSLDKSGPLYIALP